MVAKEEARPVFREEVKNFGLENKVIDFRIGGYPKGPLGLWSSYYEERKDGSLFITIDGRVKNTEEFRRKLRHELGHIKHPSDAGVLYAVLVEYLPLERLF